VGSSSGQGVVPGPSTYMGRWLRAALLNQVELRNRLNTTLNNGKPGWNSDEPAIMEAALELAAREYFGDDYDVRAITEFVTRLRARIRSVQPQPRLETEAVIRSALGEADVITSDIHPQKKLSIQLRVLALITVLLGWDEPKVDRVIVAAETKAIERGWNPPRLPA
jgi:hypothetical protein